MSEATPWWRGPVWSFAIAVAAALLTYAVGIAGNSAQSGIFPIVGILFVLPACLSAFVCALADPRGTWPSDRYLKVPLVLFALVTLGAIVFFQEGLICLVMLMPPWIAAGLGGVALLYRARRRVEGARLHAAAFLLLPLLLVQAERASPPAWQERTVTRSIAIAAPPERVWPLLLALPAIGPDEGRWTVSQNLLAVPRPVAAVIRATPTGPVRFARWQDGVHFAEALSVTEPGRALAWRFEFPDPTLHHRVDRHIDPRGAMLDIMSGGYRLEPLPDGGTRLVLTTRYRMRTWAAPYTAWWGELILGDIQRNVLGIIADRAEEGVITATLDLARVKRHRAAFGFFRDRRPDLYGRLVADI